MIIPAVFVAGILIFACLSGHNVKGFNVSFIGLVLAAGAIAFSIRKPGDLLRELGLNPIRGIKYLLLLAGLMTGVIFAVLYRRHLGQQWLPSGLGIFMITAAAIGFTEELLFRGCLQTQLRKLNMTASVLFATLAHTAYKVLLFNALKPVHEVNLMFLFTWTFIVGLIFGILKETSGSTYAPAAGHVTFDILVYGGLSQAPWWIWV